MDGTSLRGGSPLRLVAGLGNPGDRYAATRHNVGFRVVDRLAEEYGIRVERRKAEALYGRGRIEAVEVVLAKPIAFMNRSGPPLRGLCDFFQVRVEDLLVIHDDIDLEFGRLKIKAKGGHGGHNGIRSIMEAFGGGDFARLRVGIGRGEAGERVADYVLDRFLPEENARLGEILDRARDAAVTILCRGITIGMNRFNVKS